MNGTVEFRRTLFRACFLRRVVGLCKPIVAVALAATCAGALGMGAVGALPSARGAALSGIPLPAIRLPSLVGGSVTLSDFRGKPVVINVWATWCPPCVRELPALIRAQAKHPEIRFVFVAQDRGAQPVRTFLRLRHLGPRNVLLDTTGVVVSRFRSAALPTTFFFDARGRMTASHPGALSASTLAQYLTEISGGKR